MELSSAVFEMETLRGFSLRCKRDKTKMPWGLLVRASPRPIGAHCFFRELLSVRESTPMAFLMGKASRPIGYPTELACFRHVKYCDIQMSRRANYIMHCMKCAALTWTMPEGVHARRGWQPFVPLLRGTA